MVHSTSMILSRALHHLAIAGLLSGCAASSAKIEIPAAPRIDPEGSTTRPAIADAVKADKNGCAANGACAAMNDPDPAAKKPAPQP